MASTKLPGGFGCATVALVVGFIASICLLLLGPVEVYKRVRTSMGGPLAGKILSTAVTSALDGKPLIWAVVDEGISVYTETTYGGTQTRGMVCYVTCRMWVSVRDGLTGEEVFREQLPNSGSPSSLTRIVRFKDHLLLVSPRTDERGPIVRVYDPSTPGAGSEELAAISPQLSAGIVEARAMAAQLRISTTDGREVKLPLGAEAAVKRAPLVLLAPDRDAPARAHLYRVSLGDEDAPTPELTAEVLKLRQTSEARFRDDLDRLQRRKKRARGRRSGEDPKRRQTRYMLGKARAKLRALEGSASEARLGAIRRRISRLEQMLEKLGVPAIEEQQQNLVAPPEFTLAKVDDEVYLEAWVFARSEDAALILHQQVAGPVSERLLTCVGADGQRRWQLKGDSLPENWRRDDTNNPFSKPFFLKSQAVATQGHGVLLLQNSARSLQLLDPATGETRLTVAY